MYDYQLWLLLGFNYELIKGSSANMSSHNKIAEAFPYPNISPIIDQPGYESISEVHLQLNANSASVRSHLSNGALGLPFLTVLQAVYNTLSLIPFIPPVNPGPDPTILTGSTGPQISDILLQFFTNYYLAQ